METLRKRLLAAAAKILNRSAEIPARRRPVKPEGLPPFRNVTMALTKNGWIQEGLAEDARRFLGRPSGNPAGLS